ncbi:hypothetical protein NPIL_152491 [Nephila pilipes]|uniref:Uncharacterized protein n=1 Tax=Nephila pilipes TaxID=299642 RepID=A0A8X6TZV2_NEPPI|nr:hypothetical protein NPIL_152491 [Nephila pilipes]
MNALLFLFVCSTFALTCQIAWQIYDSQPEESELCVCYCSDGSMSLPEIAARVEYKGFKKDRYSCTCQDFLIPRLESSMLTQSANETCEMCECGNAFEPQCMKNGMPTMKAKLTIVTTTIWSVTTFILLVTYCNVLVLRRSRSALRRRRDYVRIEENADPSEKQELISKVVTNP